MILCKAINIVTEQIKLVNRQIPYVDNFKEQMYWTGTKVQLVEYVYPLRDVKCINNGKITLKKLFNGFGHLFNFEVNDYARVFSDIKNRRTDDNTPFLDSLRDAQKRLIEEANLRPSRK
jgi:hypothetical protein